jgi:hypothetical protein
MLLHDERAADGGLRCWCDPGYGAWELTAGSIFKSFSAAETTLFRWQTDRNLRAQAASALRSSSFRSSAWATASPDRGTLELGALLQQEVGNCNAIHHYAAEALVVEDMLELQNHEICYRFRERVLITEDAILGRLHSVPTTDLTSAKMAIGIDRMRDICSDCMLLRFQRQNLPQLCDPAAHMGCAPGGTQTGRAR